MGLEDEDEDVLAVLAAGSATDFERSLPDLWNNLGSLPVAPGDDEEGERLFCLEAIEVVAAAVVDGEEWCERTSYVWSRRAWARGAPRSDSASALTHPLRTLSQCPSPFFLHLHAGSLHNRCLSLSLTQFVSQLGNYPLTAASVLSQFGIHAGPTGRTPIIPSTINAPTAPFMWTEVRQLSHPTQCHQLSF